MIKAGLTTGYKAIVSCKVLRKDGKEAVIEGTSIGCVYDNSEMEDYCEWETIGIPSLTLKMPKPDTTAITCASTINRI